MSQALAPAPASADAKFGQGGIPEPEWIVRAADEKGWTWARRAWARAAAVEGAWFDHAKADAVVAHWPKWFQLTDDRFAGVPFRLAFWQEVIIRLMFGWKRPIEIVDPWTHSESIAHVRLFRRLFLWVPRKNGKTEFFASLALAFWAYEKVVGGQGYCFARNEKQAKIVFAKMGVMIANNPDLASEITPFKKSYWRPEWRTSFDLLSGGAEGKHGFSATVVVGDEMHEWVTADTMNHLHQSTGARLQPVELYASTAGLRSQRTGYDLFEEAAAIDDGTLENVTTLSVIFALGDEEDWTDEANWRRVNPNIGLSPTINYLREEFTRARNNPRAEAHFRRYHLNQWVESDVRWLPLDLWKACGRDGDWKTRHERFRNRKAYIGIDISTRRDITAGKVWILPDDDDPRTHLVCKFWVPAEAIEIRSKQDRVDYDLWAASGAIEATPGNYVDQEYVRAWVRECFAFYDVQGFGYDPWNATKLVTDLQADGIDVEKMFEVRQGVQSLGEASKHFEELVFAGLLEHGGHPVMHWMGRNAYVTFDRNMNFRPDKKVSREKIDGITAAVTAAAVFIRPKDEEPDLDAFLSNPVHS